MADELRRSPSGEAVILNTDNIVNESSLPGATLTDALGSVGGSVVAGSVPTAPTGDPGSPTNPGYASRHVYVNAASTLIGTIFAGVVVEAAPASFATAASLPEGNAFTIEIAGAGGGGGGGSGTEGLSGAGGGGGARRSVSCSRQDLIASLPIPISVGLGGAPGLGNHTNNLIIITAATAGGSGGTTSFGSFWTAGSGSGGQIDATGHHGGTGGGIANAPTPTTSTNAQLGGAPAVVAGASGVFLEGAGHGSTATSRTDGTPAVYGGASGGCTGISEVASGIGGRSVYGGGGGGGGRPTNTTVGIGAAGGDGGGRWLDATIIGGGGLGGPGTDANNAAPTPGAAGANGDVDMNGNGGGGGGSNDGNVTVAIAGAGGQGGFPGGGGGGGGATRLAAFTARTCIGGAGGAGGDACIIITGFV
jgi:hypothetical protein